MAVRSRSSCAPNSGSERVVGATYITTCIGFGLACGVIGRIKGSSFFIWFLIGLVLNIFGLITALLYRFESDVPEIACPRCGKQCKVHDAVCMRCGAELDLRDVPGSPAASSGRLLSNG